MKGFVNGPALSDEEGTVYSSRAINDCLHKVFASIDKKHTKCQYHIEGQEELRKTCLKLFGH
jgi:hypothetical protein